MPAVVATEGYVSNEPLRLAFLESGITANELAIRAGMERTFSAPKRGGTGRSYWTGGESTAVLRDLGLKPDTGKGMKGKMRRAISEQKALRYAKALHLDPMDIGL